MNSGIYYELSQKSENYHFRIVLWKYNSGATGFEE